MGQSSRQAVHESLEKNQDGVPAVEVDRSGRRSGLDVQRRREVDFELGKFCKNPKTTPFVLEWERGEALVALVQKNSHRPHPPSWRGSSEKSAAVLARTL